MQYYQVFIAAEQTAQANRILDALINKQLVLGGPVIGGPAKYLWNFKDSDASPKMEPRLFTVQQDERYIITYTREDLKDELIEVAESASLEEVTMISLLPMEMGRSLKDLIDSAFEGRESGVTPESVDAVPALTFVPTSEIPTRTKSSTGPLGTRR